VLLFTKPGTIRGCTVEFIDIGYEVAVIAAPVPGFDTENERLTPPDTAVYVTPPGIALPLTIQ
jgi:hypothetical protein